MNNWRNILVDFFFKIILYGCSIFVVLLLCMLALLRVHCVHFALWVRLRLTHDFCCIYRGFCFLWFCRS